MQDLISSAAFNYYDNSLLLSSLLSNIYIYVYTRCSMSKRSQFWRKLINMLRQRDVVSRFTSIMGRLIRERFLRTAYGSNPAFHHPLGYTTTVIMTPIVHQVFANGELRRLHWINASARAIPLIISILARSRNINYILSTNISDRKRRLGIQF